MELRPCPIKATLPEHREQERKVLEPEQVLKILDFTCRKEYYDYPDIRNVL